jgi:hypothetical protein
MYEVAVTLEGTSYYEDGGAYNVSVEATDDAGLVATTSGTTMKGLNLVLLENTPPEITLISPTPGYLTTSIPSFTFKVTDDGSGVDLASFSATVDGEELSVSYTGDNSSATVTATAKKAVADGSHTVIFTAKDRDGNSSDISAAYVVDTTPPVLTVYDDDIRVLTDATSVVISGMSYDVTAPPISVSVASNGNDLGGIPTDDNGAFSTEIPLDVGWNDITISSQDGAGLVQTYTFRVLRLITDRTQEDVDNWTDKGSYNASDLNRVGEAVKYLADVLTKRGYAISVTAKTDWAKENWGTVSTMRAYLQDVATLFNIAKQWIGTAITPPGSTEKLKFTAANDIEQILLNIYDVTRLLDLNVFYSGEVFAGEV